MSGEIVEQANGRLLDRGAVVEQLRSVGIKAFVSDFETMVDDDLRTVAGYLVEAVGADLDDIKFVYKESNE